MEPHLGWTHELQLHEMRLLVVCRIMDPPQLVDLIEPAIHIRVPTLQIELNKSAPARRSPYRSQTLEPCLLPWHPPKQLVPELPYFACHAEEHPPPAGSSLLTPQTLL